MFSSSSKKSLIKNKSVSKTLKKTQKSKQSKQSNHIGGGAFTITPKTYTNIKYGKSWYSTPELTCLQCKNNVFRRHKVVSGSRMHALILGEGSQIFGKKNNNFVCYKCEFIMVSFNRLRFFKILGFGYADSAQKLKFSGWKSAMHSTFRSWLCGIYATYSCIASLSYKCLNTSIGI